MADFFIFKKDLGTFVRFYEFMSQIVDYDDTSLEKLCLYARNLQPLLRESLLDEDEIDLSNVLLSHYRLSKIKQQALQLKDEADDKLQPGGELGSGKAKDKKEELVFWDRKGLFHESERGLFFIKRVCVRPSLPPFWPPFWPRSGR